jgi:hypothetical protein
MVAEMVFHLRIDGNRLSGMVHMGSWPGILRYPAAKINGVSFWFAAIGKSPWRASGPVGRSKGYARLKFSGTIQHNETLKWDSISI